MYIIESVENCSPEDEYTKEINTIIEKILPSKQIDIIESDLNEDIKSFINTIISYISYNTINGIIYVKPEELDEQQNNHICSILEKIPNLSNIKKIWNIAKNNPITFKIEYIDPNKDSYMIVSGTPGIKESITVIRNNFPRGNKPPYIKISIESVNKIYTPPIYLEDNEYETLLSITSPNTQPTFRPNQIFDIPINTHKQIIQIFTEKYLEKSESIKIFLDNIQEKKQTRFISKYKYKVST